MEELPVPRVALPAVAELYDLSLQDAFPQTFDDPVAFVQHRGVAYVAERAGRVWSFDPRADTPDATLTLDLRQHTIGYSDAGLLGLAVRDGELYAYYAWTEEPVLSMPEDRALPHYARLSRFSLDAAGRVAAPDSEAVLISLHDQHLYHQGGGMFFHPEDGFLYLSIGDEGRTRCRLGNCQRVDRSLFSGVLRIDVDMRGGEVSHPILRQPADGETAGYYIPNDNPFVGREDTLEEFYAVGLRNPFTMSLDPVDGFIWIGDVGENLAEEVNVLAAGANYQWPVYEGEELVDEAWDLEAEQLGEWTGPVLAYPRDELKVMIGGLVYRGDRVPSLYGAYLHAGFRTGGIYAVRYEAHDGRVVVTDKARVLESGLREDTGITGFAVDDDGRLLVLHMGQGVRIQQLLAQADSPAGVPERLSQTGLFSELTSLTPLEWLHPYEVNSPLWSDGADKQRFVFIPEGEVARLDGPGPPELPVGTVLVKHFSMRMDAADPDSARHLETRVLRVYEDGVRAATYRWRADQRDADLLLAHAEETLTLRDEDGVERTQAYHYPGPGECLRCHAPGTGDALGFRAEQLRRGAQLDALVQGGLVAVADGHDVGTGVLPAFDDPELPVEERVRAYLHANCAYCHGEQSIYGASWDARFTTPLDRAHILPAAEDAEDADDRDGVVAPGDARSSRLWRRVASEAPDRRMPPLGTTRPDPAFVALLSEWIEGLPCEDDDCDAD